MSTHYEPLKKRAQIKAEAKNLLGGKWLEGSVFVFIAMILISLVGAFAYIFMMFENGIAFYVLIYAAYTCLIGYVFSVALAKYFKKIGDGEHATFSELTKPFSYYSDVVVFSIITILLALVPLIINIVAAFVFWGTYVLEIFSAVLSLILIPIGLIYEAWIYYVMLDLGEATLKEVLSRSFFLAKKSWFQFIILSLSFIGWYIAGMCACGIGMYVVMPYFYTSVALFHKNLKAHYFGVEAPDTAEENLCVAEDITDSIICEELQTDNTEENGEEF